MSNPRIKAAFQDGKAFIPFVTCGDPNLETTKKIIAELADAGAADTIRLDGQQLFRLCGDDGHHHHLVCRRCGKTVEIDPPSEAWLRKVADGHGFTVESHTLEVFGLCSDCQKEQKAQKAQKAVSE